MKTRTIVREMPPKYNYGDDPDLFQLCIDEHQGCGLSHSHQYGHDFPMERAELEELREQIDRILVIDDSVADNLIKPDSGAHDHCWHNTGVELLSKPPQVVEICCWCGKERHYLKQDSVQPLPVGEHGPMITLLPDLYVYGNPLPRPALGPGLTWGENRNREPGQVHIEWHAPCGCAFHPKPFPHIHPCTNEHKRPDLHTLTEDSERERVLRRRRALMPDYDQALKEWLS